MDQPGVAARTSSEEVRRGENDTFPVLVPARECRLARQVRRSRPASASWLFPTLKAECGAYLRESTSYKKQNKKLEHKNFCSPHTVQLVRRANCPCCSRVTCLRTGELCISFLWLLDYFLLLLHFVLLTDAATVLVLYCRFLEKKRTHEDLLSKEKTAPMALIVTLGQQYHVGVCVGQSFIF